MCGIVAVVGEGNVIPEAVEGLAMLEYRGYDSAGIATLQEGRLIRRRAEGALERLRSLLAVEPVRGTAVIGHTRWATHGAPTATNAHPHATERVAIVHNGIVENHDELRRELVARGARFSSDTDTEVITWLIHFALEGGDAPVAALRKATDRVLGHFAVAALFAGRDDLVVGTRRGSPLAAAEGPSGIYLSSDLATLARWADQGLELEDGDIVTLSRGIVRTEDAQGREVHRARQRLTRNAESLDKGSYAHFTLKEIHEQTLTIGQTLVSWRGDEPSRAQRCRELLGEASRLYVAACGTSYYAGSVARNWFEKLAGLPTTVEHASEFRYREPELEPGAVILGISQSGETADTLAALRYGRAQERRTMAIVNVQGSAMDRETDGTLLTRAGREVGVASTKAFTAQLAAAAALALDVGRARGRLSVEQHRLLHEQLAHTGSRIGSVLQLKEQIESIAPALAAAKRVLFLGRGAHFPLAMEGALKLKEISYVHAEGFAAGEMKHGPIALVEHGTPIVVTAPSGALFDKTASNLIEVASRGARIILITDSEGRRRIGEHAHTVLEIDAMEEVWTPIVYAIPLQLLAYCTAVAAGREIDRPRNLAKSVTVE